ncbi:unnamed protein product, partial [Laminaria digitata]
KHNFSRRSVRGPARASFNPKLTRINASDFLRTSCLEKPKLLPWRDALTAPPSWSPTPRRTGTPHRFRSQSQEAEVRQRKQQNPIAVLLLPLLLLLLPDPIPFPRYPFRRPCPRQVAHSCRPRPRQRVLCTPHKP